jgi:membrane dipeptidase
MMPMQKLRADELVADTVVWENHCCMPFEDAARWMPQIERYRAAGFDVVHVNIGDSDIPLDRMLRALAGFRYWLADRTDEYALVNKVNDILDAKKQGKLAICFDIEGAHALGTDLGLIQIFYQLGVRWLLLAYNCANAVGSGCHDAVDGGLTAFGRLFVAEMDRIGMIKDVAHTGHRTAREVIESSTVPVNISHSNPRALNNHPRCVPDDLMKACAASGGVMGISGLGLFLGGNDVSTTNVIRSIDYSVQVMGIDHVGIGLDFVFDQQDLSDGYELKRHIWPDGFGYGVGNRFAQPEQLREIVEGLLVLGYRETDVRKIIGGNFLRVAQQVWK